MATITRFEDIEAWQTARKLASQIYDLTDRGAFARDHGLKDQIRHNFTVSSLIWNPNLTPVESAKIVWNTTYDVQRSNAPTALVCGAGGFTLWNMYSTRFIGGHFL